MRGKKTSIISATLVLRYRNIKKGGKRPLEYREHALAYGCDIPGGCKYNIG